MLKQSNEIKKTRKEHKCYDCYKIIPKWSSCYSATTTDKEYTNTIQTAYWCEKCVSEADKEDE
jgi:hypothetical protein